MMGKNSSIEWTDHTFNPWVGCAKVSAGCQHCYAEALMDTRFGRVQWGVNGTRQQTNPANWVQVRRWNAEAVRTGVRRRVFCGSLCDWLEDRHDTNAWRISLLELIELTHGLDWLMLTKRPENAVRLIQQAAGRSVESFFERNPHVWFGTSVENQEQADKRIPHLLNIPARVRFLSMEPLLGPVDLTRIDYGGEPGSAIDCLRELYWQWYYDGDHLIDKAPTDDARTVNWVIVGGESGNNARPMHPDWARSIRAQCQAAGVPFFFKQWGEWALADYGELPSVWVDEDTVKVVERTTNQPEPPPFRSAAIMRRVGKHAAGRLLDGREWNEVPE